jgi:D-alanyl-lipoteichoic acid acyltransferase DltB (MBOAT superfamily)
MVFVYIIGLEIWLHYFYHYNYNVKKIWLSENFSSLEVCITAYWTLNFMYIKFLIFWRVFRIMALFDGIETIENMNRCVNNNFTFTGFWRQKINIIVFF